LAPTLLRLDRPAVFGGADGQRLQYMPTHAPTVGVAHVVDLAPDARIELAKADLAFAVGGDAGARAQLLMTLTSRRSAQTQPF
jgi:hypothetical protein